MRIDRDRKSCKVCLTQKKYLQKLLQKFNIQSDTTSVSIYIIDHLSVYTSLTSHFKLVATMSPKPVEEHEYMSHVPYASKMYSLMYAMVCIRSHFSQVLTMVSRYMHDPENGYWKAVKWILRYIKSTVDVG